MALQCGWQLTWTQYPRTEFKFYSSDNTLICLKAYAGISRGIIIHLGISLCSWTVSYQIGREAGPESPLWMFLGLEFSYSKFIKICLDFFPLILYYTYCDWKGCFFFFFKWREIKPFVLKDEVLDCDYC